MVVAVGSVTISNIDSGFAEQLLRNEEVVDSFLEEVARFVRDDAKGTAAFVDRTGNLRKSIGMRKSKFPKGGWIVKAAGRNKINGSTRARGFHAHLVEFGHRMVTSSGRDTGKRVPPHPFMRPALEKGKAYASSKIGSIKRG